MLRLFLIAILAAASSAEADTTTRPADKGDHVVGTAVYAGDTILLDYYPKSQLVTPETIIERAKFPAIDVHCHWHDDVEQADLLAAMEPLNLAYAVNLSGGSNIEAVRSMLEQYDDPRLLTLVNLDFTKVGDDAYFEQYLREAKAAGAAGVKVFKNLGLTVKDPKGQRLAVDDSRLDVIWRTAGELDMPVLIHVADPAAFFDPIDEHNERWMQLFRRPTWSFYGDAFPSREQLLIERDNIVARHPKTKFIGAHIANEAEDLGSVAERMRRLPNLYADISGRVAELGRQPYSARRFFLEFPDRILFGTDRYPGREDQPRYRPYYRFLETADEYFDYHEHDFPPTGEWKIYGIFLPDEVLKDVYHDNTARLFGLPTLDEAEPSQ
jgi:predicted TIM-barrel fold metal-dependent hydrolase